MTAYSGDKGSRKVSNHYPTMTIPEICKLPIHSLSSENCILAMWITGPHLDKLTAVFSSWKFKFGGILFTWIKETKSRPARPIYGLGFYSRKNTELLVYGKKGNPGKPVKVLNELIFARRREHSQKPVETYSRLEAMWPNLKKIELFARNQREGWDNWGNEIESEVVI